MNHKSLIALCHRTTIMTVLMAYDGKPHTKKALDYAIEYAKSFNDTLYIMSVIPSKDFIDETGSIRAFLDGVKSEASEKGVKAITIIEAGHPSEVILSAAKRFECNVIIVGRADDKTGLDRVVLGSVSNSIVSNAQCTVIVVQ